MAILSFADAGTEDLFNGVNSKRARRVCPPTLHAAAQEQLDILNAATALGDLRMPQSNRLEALKGDRRGQHSIRVNDQYRVVFRWTGSDAADVAVVDYH